MKIKIVRVEPTTQISQTGKKKYYVYDAEGERHISWGDWAPEAKGQEVEVTLKKESFKGNDYTVVWPVGQPAETAPIASEVAVRHRTKLLSDDNDTLPSNSKGNIMDRRDRMMAKESALKSAAQVWSTRVEARIDDSEKEDPLDMAKQFYRWILSED